MTNFVIDHLGFVTHDISASRTLWCEILGFSSLTPEIVDKHQKVTIQFLSHEAWSDCRIELLAPLDQNSSVFKSARLGGGLHHICVRVRTLEAFAEKLSVTGLTSVRKPAPAPAFGGRRVAFAYTPGFGLIEFVESVEAPDLTEFAHSLFAQMRETFLQALPQRLSRS